MKVWNNLNITALVHGWLLIVTKHHVKSCSNILKFQDVHNLLYFLQSQQNIIANLHSLLNGASQMVLVCFGCSYS